MCHHFPLKRLPGRSAVLRYNEGTNIFNSNSNYIKISITFGNAENQLNTVINLILSVSFDGLD